MQLIIRDLIYRSTHKKLLFMKRMKTPCNYEAPELHVELLAVERGFALSGSTIDGWEEGGRF